MSDPVIRPESLFGIDFRGSTACVMGLTGRGSYSLVCKVPLGEGLTCSRILSETACFSAAFSAISETVAGLGGQAEAFILCIPDSFSLRSLLRLRRIAAETGFRLTGIIRESSAAALYFYYGQRRPCNLMILNITAHSSSVSLFSLGGGAVSLLHSSICPLEHGIERSVHQNFISYPFTLSGNYPAVLLTAGRPDAVQEADRIARQFLSSERPQQCASPSCFTSSAEVFRLGLGVLCGLHAHLISGIFLSEPLSPYPVYASMNGRGSAIRDAELPFTLELAGNLKPEDLQSGILFSEESLQDELAFLDRIDLSSLKGTASSAVLACDEAGLTVRIQDQSRNVLASLPVTGDHPSLPPIKEAADKDEALLAFLPVIDSLEYGCAHASEEDPGSAGLSQIYKQALSVLEKLGVTRYGNPGDSFDAHLHQAVAHITDIDLPENSVKQVLQSGYRKNDRILRYASVVVAN